MGFLFGVWLIDFSLQVAREYKKIQAEQEAGRGGAGGGGGRGGKGTPNGSGNENKLGTNDSKPVLGRGKVEQKVSRGKEIFKFVALRFFTQLRYF